MSNSTSKFRSLDSSTEMTPKFRSIDSIQNNYDGDKLPEIQQSSNSEQIIFRKKQSDENTSNNYYSAYLYSLASNCSIVVVQLSVKQLTHYFPAFLILGLRGSLLMILNFSIMKYNGIDFDVKNPENFKMLLKRSIFSAITMTMYMAPIQFIPIGVASTLFNTGPLMAFFIQALYYKKTSIQWIHVFITLISFCGIVLIIQPEFLFGNQQKISMFHQILYGVVLLSALASCLSMILIHDLRNKTNQHVTLQYGYIFQGNTNFMLYLIFCQSFQVSNHHQPFTLSSLLKFILLLIVLVISGFTTQYTRVRSMYLCKPTRTMPIAYVSVILGMVVDICFFEAQYNKFMILGAICTSCGLLSKFIVEK